MSTHFLMSEWICVVSKLFCNIKKCEIPTAYWERQLYRKWGSYNKMQLVCIISQARKETLPKASVTQRPEVVDDFVRNFLVKVKMYRTLDCFQTEWFEFHQFCISRRPMLYGSNRNNSYWKKNE